MTDSECSLDERVDKLETAIVDIRGESGNNGKLGALKARVDTAESRRWAVLLSLLGMLVGLAASAIAVGRWVGRIDTEVDSLKTRINRRALPPDAPADRATP